MLSVPNSTILLSRNQFYYGVTKIKGLFSLAGWASDLDGDEQLETGKEELFLFPPRDPLMGSIRKGKSLLMSCDY
jgi:hypothetical protein